MPIFHFNYDEEMRDLSNWRLERDRREQLASEIQPEWGERAAAILSRYPWLSPGAVIAAMKDGWDDTAPQIGAVADVEFQRRTTQDDWHQPGDVIKAPGVPTYQLFGEEVSNATRQETEGEGQVGPQAVPRPGEVQEPREATDNQGGSTEGI